jgi:xanthine dehydrogenase accessory factor
MPSLVLIRGGGDLATGVALRLIRTGLRVVVTELPQPLAVRRTVSFAEAVYAAEMAVEGITARRVDDPADSLRILTILGNQQVPVLLDPDCISVRALHPSVIVDGRMNKRPPEDIGYSPLLYIGLGPGFEAGVNCQVVIETRRGHTLGRVYWLGGPEPDTGQPEGDPSRVLRAPADGILVAYKQIGDHCDQGELIAEIQSSTINPQSPILNPQSPILNPQSPNPNPQPPIPNPQSSILNNQSPIISPFPGILRGLLHPGLTVTRGMKIGDVDPRDDPRLCQMVSDKALAIGGGVLEAILSRPELRSQLW